VQANGKERGSEEEESIADDGKKSADKGAEEEEDIGVEGAADTKATEEGDEKEVIESKESKRTEL
jgi:hypothetical protein